MREIFGVGRSETNPDLGVDLGDAVKQIGEPDAAGFGLVNRFEARRISRHFIRFETAEQR